MLTGVEFLGLSIGHNLIFGFGLGHTIFLAHLESPLYFRNTACWMVLVEMVSLAVPIKRLMAVCMSKTAQSESDSEETIEF